MPLETDFVLRALQQLAQALARILGLRKAGHIDEAIEEVDAALASIAGVDPRLLLAVEVPAVAAVLADPTRIRIAGRLAAERAILLEQRGDGSGARLWRQKAADLTRAAVTAGGPLDAEGEAIIQAAAADAARR